MAVNLDKNREAIVGAWKDVVDDKTATDWALFGYEGQSNDVKLVAKGDGGLEELQEELNSGKIMYAFCRVRDPKTGLSKFVLINWQGEGAPAPRKGMCANHVRDVSALLKSHLTLNARTEDEVEPELVLSKVGKASGSNYEFGERGNLPEAGPVGTTYKRVVASAEIDSAARDRFWEQEEREERLRQEQEMKRREEERQHLEAERREREAEEERRREQRSLKEERRVSEVHQAEREAVRRRVSMEEEHQRNRWEKQREEEKVEEESRRGRENAVRRQRSQEAQALIAQRTVDARAVFERHTSVGQLLTRRPSQQSMGGSSEDSSSSGPKINGPLPSSPTATTTTTNASNAININNVQLVHAAAAVIATGTEPRLVSDAAVKEEVPPPASNGPVNGQEEDEEWDSEPAELIRSIHNTSLQKAAAEPHATQIGITAVQKIVEDDSHETLGLRARALYDYQAADETEISFDPGDVITHVDQIDEGWWQGLAPDGAYGLFPANYVELLD